MGLIANICLARWVVVFITCEKNKIYLRLRPVKYPGIYVTLVVFVFPWVFPFKRLESKLDGYHVYWTKWGFVNRQLNPDLFDSVEKNPKVELNSSNGLALRQLQKKVKQTDKKLSAIESLVEVLQSQVKVMGENEMKRTEAFSKAITDLEKSFQEGSLKQEGQLREINDRLGENEVVSEQVASLIERFNSNISQFENKMAALKSVISEKEMKLMSYREIIEQLVHDVEKLKGL